MASDFSLAAFFKPCGHGKTEDIKNGYDKIIGLQCLECMELLWSIGKCEGCHNGAAKLKIVYRSSETGRLHRFCDDNCKQQHRLTPGWNDLRKRNKR